VQTRDLDGDRVQRLQLLAEGGGRRLLHQRELTIAGW
jgi:hypothetical protein